ncbi:MAG: PLD nuclease N-terminal domain-containing protein [Rhodococcus sp. (in: high G+C Gram-positive bacteria)]
MSRDTALPRMGDTGQVNGDMNPTLPLAFDVAWTALVVIWIVLSAVAVVSIVRTRHDRSGAKLWWCLFVLAVPVIGSLVWFWPGRARTERR